MSWNCGLTCVSLRSASVYTHDSPRENALYSSNATLKKDGRKKKTERKKMPTLLTWSRWTPPFLGLGPGDFWAAAGGAADPLGWGRRRGEVTLPLTEFSAGEPLCLEKGSWRRHQVGGGTED